MGVRGENIDPEKQKQGEGMGGKGKTWHS